MAGPGAGELGLDAAKAPRATGLTAIGGDASRRISQQTNNNPQNSERSEQFVS
jgi:hypothetical protein